MDEILIDEWIQINGVMISARCLDWCRGVEVHDDHTEICAVSHSASIINCFHEGKDDLPGLPQKVKVKPIDAHSAMVFWELPEKNPGTVDMYRVFWRQIGSR